MDRQIHDPFVYDDIRFKNQPGPENRAGNQWGWPDAECMDIMPGLGKQGG